MKLYFYYGENGEGQQECGSFSDLCRAIHYLLTFNHVTIVDSVTGQTLVSIAGGHKCLS